MENVKSPLNYTGGKFKLLPEIKKILPSEINTFVDLFCGGANVGVNIDAKKIICNDIEWHVIELMNFFKIHSIEEIILGIENIIEKYNLTDTYRNGYEFYGCNSNDGVAKINKENFRKLREDYNKNPTPLVFYCLIIFAFNNQIKFNKKGGFSVAVNKRDFNDALRKKLKKFIERVQSLNISFMTMDFTQFNFSELTSNDIVYCDPPYLITCASYNEQDGWNETKENQLLNLLDELNEKEIKFVLSNVLESKGKSNELLKTWSEKYNVHYLNHSYGNCNYHTKDKSKNSTVEVLITNY